MCPEERLKRTQKIRERMLKESGLPETGVEALLAGMQPLPPWQDLQQTWNEMFMIDIEPENRKRFGLDLRTIVDRITSCGSQ